MDAYRLYTVVPDLVRFIENLTNIYVRYNRTRLKGRLGVEDCKFALASLFDVLLTVCKVTHRSPPQCKGMSGQAETSYHGIDIISYFVNLDDLTLSQSPYSTVAGTAVSESGTCKCIGDGPLHALLLRVPLPEPQASSARGCAQLSALV